MSMSPQHASRALEGPGDFGATAAASTTRLYTLQAGVEREHRISPCTRCPWRTDVDLTAFSERDMEMLRRANGVDGAEAPLDAPAVACHLDQPDTAHAFRWCAGWLAVVGEHHLAIRLAVMFEALPGQALAPRPHWPELYASLDALLEARATQCAHAQLDSTKPAPPDNHDGRSPAAGP